MKITALLYSILLFSVNYAQTFTGDTGLILDNQTQVL
ncbi:MAG: hypothetical protein RI883_278 [Bacteroidota bacterium]|jgi:hypothetical protein